MDVVDGNCVLCTNNTEVLDTLFCEKFLVLLKAHYFEVNNEDFKQFSKLFVSRNEVRSFCVPCAVKLSVYFETRNVCNEANKTGTSGRTCSNCNNTDYITKCSKKKGNDFEFVFKGIKKTSRHISYACLRCLLSINVFKEIKESINKLLKTEDSEDSATSESVIEKNTNMKKYKLRKVATKPQSLKKRNNDNKNEIQTYKRLKTDRNEKLVVEGKQSKTKRGRPSNILEKKLKHLNNVNAETVERDMHLSYQVVTDQKLMFDIPFVNCSSIESPKLKSKLTRQQVKKRKLISNDDVINVSSSDEQEESDTSTRSQQIVRKSYRTRQNRISNSGTSGNDSETILPRKRIVSQKSFMNTKQAKSKKGYVIESSDDEPETSSKTTSKESKVMLRSSTPRISAPLSAFKIPKTKVKGPVKTQGNKKTSYHCNKCAKILKMKYMVVLHELEHDCSYSPMISIEKRDLLALKDNLKLENKTDLETVTTESADIEKEIDATDTEENQDGDLKSVKENEDAKDATEKTDKEDIPTENEITNDVDGSNENKDEAEDILDVSTEKDVVETDKDEEDKEESRLDEVVETHNEDGIVNSPEKQNDSEEDKIAVEDTPQIEKESSDVIKVTSDDEEDAVVGSPKDETNKRPSLEIDKNDEVIVLIGSPRMKAKIPSLKKSDEDVSAENQDNVELEKETIMEIDNSSDNEETITTTTTTNGKIKNKQNSSNNEETLIQEKDVDVDTTDKVKSPEKKSITSPKKQDLKEYDDESNEQEKFTTTKDKNDAAKSIRKSSKSPSPKRAKSTSPKKVEPSENQDGQTTKTDNKDSNADEIKISDEREEEEKSKDIPKEIKDLSPISSDNESNTEPNDNGSKASDFSDNDNEQQGADEKLNSNGFTECEYDEFTLKLSSSEESNSPDKKNLLNQENESSNNILSEETTSPLHKSYDQDTFQIVENILQNLGA